MANALQLLHSQCFNTRAECSIQRIELHSLHTVDNFTDEANARIRDLEDAFSIRCRSDQCTRIQLKLRMATYCTLQPYDRRDVRQLKAFCSPPLATATCALDIETSIQRMSRADTAQATSSTFYVGIWARDAISCITVGTTYTHRTQHSRG